jgi:hypothetical protein
MKYFITRRTALEECFCNRLVTNGTFQVRTGIGTDGHQDGIAFSTHFLLGLFSGFLLSG